jgi:hypothetical protein
MKYVKLLLSGLLTLILLLSSFAINPTTNSMCLCINHFGYNAGSSLYSGKCGDDINWVFDKSTGELNITGTGKMTNYEYENYLPWYRIRKKIKSVIVSEGVTTVGDLAFSRCSSLSSIIIPSSLKEIGFRSFLFCKSLKNLNLPSGLKVISIQAFSLCSSLESITFPSSIEYIGPSSFENCSSLESVTFEKPCKIKEIQYRTFMYCTALKSIELPLSITKISTSAFSCCKALESVEIQSNVTEIGGWAFNECISLEKISIPQSVTNIGNRAFQNTKYYNDASNWEDGVLYLDNVLIGIDTSEIPIEYRIKDSTRMIESQAFYENKSPLAKVTIPNSVTIICNSAFIHCEKLNTVVFEDGKQPLKICENTFYETGIVNIKIPSRVTEMGTGVFFRCANLESVIFESNKHLTNIPSYTFTDCLSLKSIEIPLDITYIIRDSLIDCTSLTNVYYGGTESDRDKIKYNGPVTSSLQEATWHYNSKMPVTVESVSIKTNPTKLEYKKNEEIDLTGLVLNIRNSDGTVWEMSDTDKISVNGYDSAKGGKQTIQLKYDGYNIDLNISVKLTPLQWIVNIVSFKWL